MEPVGLAISIAGSFRICTEGYKFITSIKHASSSAVRIQCKCEIEEARFLLWGKSWGLVDESGALLPAANVKSKLVKEPITMSRLVAKTLSEIETILGGTAALKKKYGMADTIAAEVTNSRTFNEVDERISTPVSHDTGSMSLKRRITWSACDKESFQALVAELRELNSSLYLLVPMRSQSLLSEALNAEILFTRDSLQDLEMIKEVSEQEDPKLSGAVELKLLGIKTNSHDAPWNVLPSAKVPKAWFKFQIPDGMSDFHRSVSTRSVSYGSYTPGGSGDSVPVMIEWKPYDPRAVGSQAFVIAIRADGLCRLLHKFSATSLSVLPCLGFFDDVAKGCFGFAFKLPQIPLYGAPSQPVTLNSLICSQPNLPPLEDRFELSSTLARTLFAFHCSDWLHKDFSSHSILLGTTPGDSSKVDLTRPYILGFTYSRPDDHEGVSSEIPQMDSDEPLLYQHPSLTSRVAQDAPRYCKSFDLWALGCVLLEVGLWRRLRDLWKPKYSENRSKWADRLKNGWVRELRGRCGGTYEDVVKSCLASYEEETMSPSHLFWNVVVKLDTLRV
jgi:Prion-inhibition and propagation